jgi:hypothetical protein
MRLPEWVKRLHLAVGPYAIPFLFGPPPNRRTPVAIQSGTCCAVEYAGHRYLLSAAHVVCEALRAAQAGPTDVVAGPIHLALTPEIIRHIDEDAIDIATIPITASDVAAIEAAGLRVIRPGSWPLPTVQEGDGVVLAGYPGGWRTAASWHEHDFAAVTQGLLVQSLHEAEFVAHRDPAYLTSVTVTLEDVLPLGVGGCSGGPVMLVRLTPILVPQLCGIVKQGLRPVPDTEDILFRFARLDRLLCEDGSIQRP